jgi:hypothetical protein
MSSSSSVYSSSASLSSYSSSYTAESSTAVDHVPYLRIPGPDAIVTLSSIHGKAFRKQYGLSKVSERDSTRMYATVDVEYIYSATKELVEVHGWTAYVAVDGLLYDVASPAYGTGYGGVRIQLPAYTADGHIRFSDIFQHAAVEPPARYRQDEQVVADNYASACPALAQLLAVLQLVFPGHVDALHAADEVRAMRVMQLVPGPILTEWIHDTSRREDLERVLTVDDEEKSHVAAVRRYMEVTGVMLKAQGLVPPAERTSWCVSQ